MVTSDLTDRNQPVLYHSPFPLYPLPQRVNNTYERIFYSKKQQITPERSATSMDSSFCYTPFK
jgi:hypothetical protein